MAGKMSKRQHRKAVKAATKIGRKPTRKQVRAAYKSYAERFEASDKTVRRRKRG